MDASRELRRGFDADFSASSVSGSAKRRPETLRSLPSSTNTRRARAPAVPVRPCARARAGKSRTRALPGKRRRGLSLKLALPGNPAAPPRPFPTGGGADAGSAGDGVSKSCWVPKVARAAALDGPAPDASPSRASVPALRASAVVAVAFASSKRRSRAGPGVPRAARGPPPRLAPPSPAPPGARGTSRTDAARWNARFLSQKRSPFRTAPPNRTDASRPASRPAAPRGTPPARGGWGYPRVRAAVAAAAEEARLGVARLASAPSPQSSSRALHMNGSRDIAVAGARRRRRGGRFPCTPGPAGGTPRRRSERSRRPILLLPPWFRLGKRHAREARSRVRRPRRRARAPPPEASRDRSSTARGDTGTAPRSGPGAPRARWGCSLGGSTSPAGAWCARRATPRASARTGTRRWTPWLSRDSRTHSPRKVSRCRSSWRGGGRRRHSGGAGRARAVSRSDGDGRRGRARDARRVVRVRASRASPGVLEADETAR